MGKKELLRHEPRLERTDEGLVLTDGVLSMRGDFSHMKRRIRREQLTHELLVKACRIKGRDDITIFDATAGLGEDSFLLAAAGFRVIMAEKNPVIAALLEDALLREYEPEIAEAISRMRLIKGDCTRILPQLDAAPDVIYLDPMFPAREKSGLIKKKFQLLQGLETPCDDEEALLAAALDAHPVKTVVKRPLKAPCLSGREPDYSFRGSTIRFDVYT